ncbi:MAG TPA: N-acetyltransferase [Rhizomicrobium sp.]|jgi:ribosomal protein S18 acetylase RimI-like enzyme
MIVRRLTEDDYEALREIRLEALRLHPENFGADLDYEESFGREQWLARLASAVTLGGFVDEKLANELGGIVVFSKSPRKKIGHTGEIGAMYVRAPHRGSGLADALLEALIDHAVGAVEQLKLTVNMENVAAIKFYERHGFREIGRYPNSLRVGDRTYEELIMFRTVDASD